MSSRSSNAPRTERMTDAELEREFERVRAEVRRLDAEAARRAREAAAAWAARRAREAEEDRGAGRRPLPLKRRRRHWK